MGTLTGSLPEGHSLPASPSLFVGAAAQVFRPPLCRQGLRFRDNTGVGPPPPRTGSFGRGSAQELVAGGGDCPGLAHAGAQRGHVVGWGREHGGGPAGKELLEVSAVSFFIPRNNSPFELLG